MAALSQDKVKLIWIEGNGPRWGVFRIGPFNTADTWDYSTYFSGIAETFTFLTGQSTAVGTVTSTAAGVATLTLVGATAAIGFFTFRGQASTGYLV